MLKSLLRCCAPAVAALMMSGCGDEVNDERIPYAEVHLTFMTVGDWNIHGVKGDAADYRCYIYTPNARPPEKVPADFPFTGLDHTGYGGIMLVTDVLGDLHAYDMACPYEARPTVRISVPAGSTEARCSQCGSTFDIYMNHGNPLTGPAADRGYALRRYHVSSSGATSYRVVTR